MYIYIYIYVERVAWAHIYIYIYTCVWTSLYHVYIYIFIRGELCGVREKETERERERAGEREREREREKSERDRGWLTGDHGPCHPSTWQTLVSIDHFALCLKNSENDDIEERSLRLVRPPLVLTSTAAPVSMLIRPAACTAYWAMMLLTRHVMAEVALR